MVRATLYLNVYECISNVCYVRVFVCVREVVSLELYMCVCMPLEMGDAKSITDREKKRTLQFIL